MGFSDWLGSITHRMEWYDVAFVKWSVLFWTLFILTAWPAARELLLGVSWPWYLGLAIIMTIPPLRVLLSRA